MERNQSKKINGKIKFCSGLELCSFKFLNTAVVIAGGETSAEFKFHVAGVL